MIQLREFKPHLPTVNLLVATALCTLLLTSCGGSSSGDPEMEGSSDAGTDGSADSGGGDTTGSDTGGSDSGGSDGGSTGAGDGPVVGRLNITRFTTTTFVSTSFIQYSDGLSMTLNDVVGAIEQPVGSCRESPFMTSDIPVLTAQEEYFSYEEPYMDAGEVITITSSAGTWLSLLRMDNGDFITYQPEVADGAALSPVPEGLTIDVPGADFPAFANVAVGDVPDLTGVLLENNAQLTWDVGTAANELEFSLGSVAQGSSAAVYTYCRLADTGSFELPASVQATIANAQDYEFTLTRLATTVVREGNTAFMVVSRSTSEN